MNKSFRALRTANVPTRVQGHIYYALLNRQHSSPEMIKMCERAIEDVCKDPYDQKMLKEYVSTEKSSDLISLDYHTCKRRLHNLYYAYVNRVYYLMCSS